MSRGALLMDLDGTLVDSIPAWIASFRATLAHYGVELSREKFLSEIYLQRRELHEVLESLGVDEAESVFRGARDAIYIERLRAEIEWLPGAPELLASVDDTANLGIITNSWRRYVDAIHDRLGVRSHVACILAHEDVDGRTKPRPDGLLQAAVLIGAPAERSVYVGDVPHDMIAAKAAGMEGWLVRRPTTPPEAAAIATRTFDSLEAVVDAWRQR